MGYLTPEGGKINNRKPWLPSPNNCKVNHLLWVSSLNFKFFITYTRMLISPPWQHPTLYGVTASQKKILLFWTCCILGFSLELLGLQLLFNWNQQPGLAWIQSWASLHQNCLLEPEDEGKRGQVSHLWVTTLRGSCLCAWGLCRLWKQNFHSLTRKKKPCLSFLGIGR